MSLEPGRDNVAGLGDGSDTGLSLGHQPGERALRHLAMWMEAVISQQRPGATLRLSLCFLRVARGPGQGQTVGLSSAVSSLYQAGPHQGSRATVSGLRAFFWG